MLQHASVVGQTFWEGSLDGVEDEEGIDLVHALAALEEKDLVVSSAGSRLAGEHEYAFKHVLIRDVAYSTLPKSVRARKHAEVGAFIEERAADRSEGVVAMVADHYGRAAALGADAGVDRPSSSRSPRRHRRARGGGRRCRIPLLEPRGGRPLRDGAVAAPRARLRRRGLASPSSSATWPCGSGGSTGDRALGAVPRLPPPRGGPGAGRRPPPQDRRRPLAQGRPRGLDRALPARHRPAQGRPALPRARPPLRGGRLALHAHRRQHARDLRLREGAAARRATRRGRGGQPRPRDLRPGVRPDRRLRARPPEPRALGRAGPRVRSRRGRSSAAHPRLPPRGAPRPTTRAPGPPTPRRSSSPSRPATCPPRSSSTPRSPSSRSTAATGTRWRPRPRRRAPSPSARA